MQFKLISSENTFFDYREHEPFTFKRVHRDERLPFPLTWRWDEDEGCGSWYVEITCLEGLMDLMRAVEPNPILIDRLHMTIEIYDGWRE